MKRPLVIFGARQIAEVSAFYFDRDSDYEVVAFTLDSSFVHESTFLGRPLVPFEEITQTHPTNEFEMFVAIGYGRMNQLRAQKYAEAKARGYTLARYVSSKATTWPGLAPGDNTLILEANVVQPFASIGSNTTLWCGNHIGHHARVGNHCFLASHVVVSGNVEIGDHCFIGVNATLRDGIKIAPHCLVGAGTLIMRDTKPDEVYAASGTAASHVPSSRMSL